MTPKQKIQRQETLTDAQSEYGKGLSSHAFFRIHDKSVSEDLVQDTFLKTWNYLAKGGKIDLMKAFLYHILNHLIVDEYRKHKTQSLDLLLEKKGIEEPNTGFQATIFDAIDGKTAIALIAQLPEKFRKVMHMRYVRDLSLGEIAIITGQTKNAIAVQVHRGLKQLTVLFKRL